MPGKRVSRSMDRRADIFRRVREEGWGMKNAPGFLRAVEMYVTES
jgi:hypothetical protein